MLNQNAPNPFSEETEISYFISEDVTNAEIRFYNVAGRLIKSVPLDSRGEGSVMITTPYLSSGVYTYSIIADGKIIDTKQMIHK